MQTEESIRLTPKPITIVAGVACSLIMVAIGAPMGVEGSVMAASWLFLVLFATGLLAISIKKRIIRYYRAAAWLIWLSGIISFVAVMVFSSLV